MTCRLCKEKKPLSALTCPGCSPHSGCTRSTIGTSNALSFSSRLICLQQQRRMSAPRNSVSFPPIFSCIALNAGNLFTRRFKKQVECFLDVLSSPPKCLRLRLVEITVETGRKLFA